MMVPTANTERYSFLLETNLGAGRPTFLAGASGAGKTMLAAQVSRFSFQTLTLPSSDQEFSRIFRQQEEVAGCRRIDRTPLVS